LAVSWVVVQVDDSKSRRRRNRPGERLTFDLINGWDIGQEKQLFGLVAFQLHYRRGINGFSFVLQVPHLVMINASHSRTISSKRRYTSFPFFKVNTRPHKCPSDRIVRGRPNAPIVKKKKGNFGLSKWLSLHMTPL
jgi:hypothetical protein